MNSKRRCSGFHAAATGPMISRGREASSRPIARKRSMRNRLNWTTLNQNRSRTLLEGNPEYETFDDLQILPKTRNS